MKTKTELKKEGFANGRHSIIPPMVVDESLGNPVTRDLLPTAIGHFPHASGHYVNRTQKGLPDSAILIYCSDGCGWFRMGGYTHRLHAGSALIIPAGTPHAYGSTKSNPWTIYWVHFTGERLPDYLTVLNITPQTPILKLQDMGEVIHHFESMYALLINGYTPANLVALSTALSNFLGQIALHRRTNTASRKNSLEQVQRTIPFMHRHLTSNLTTTELAEVAALSVPHYSALFKSLTGQSPKSYYLKLKIEHAAHLLENTNHTIKEIGNRIGIADPYYFSRLFKKTTGLSPDHYRKNLNRKIGP